MDAAGARALKERIEAHQAGLSQWSAEKAPGKPQADEQHERLRAAQARVKPLR